MEEEGNEMSVDAQCQQEVNQRQAEVRDLMQKKNKAGALQVSLCNPPVWAKNPAIKEANAKIIESILTQITDAEMPAIIDALDGEALDNFMKYTYYFMDKNFQCSSMLKVHALLFEKTGSGAIVRTLTDRKAVWA